MTRDEVQQKIIAIAAEYGCVKPEQVTPASHFINDLEYDSLQVVEFTMAVEDEFELSVPDEKAEQLMTVGAVVDFVVEQLKSVQAA
jgi:acyl carrier protein